jgi:signal transduction histidine kinase
MRSGASRTFLLSSEQFLYGGQKSVLTMSMDVTDRKKLESDLIELNAHLEERVAQRTQALDESNQNLQNAMVALKQTQSELIQSEKLASLGSLVAGVAHELNTPLGNALLSVTTMTSDIDALTQTMAVGGLKKPAFDAFMARMKVGTDLSNRSLQRSVDLISSFKQVAVDMESERRRTFDLAETLKEVLDTLTPTIRRSPVTLEMACPPGIVLESFPGPLGQVIINLVNNSLSHAFENRATGLIRIVGSYVQVSSSVRLEISDDGVGIAHENLAHIFDPFFTTKLGKGGSGLGLSISRRIVTKILGGSIRVMPGLSEGACFELWIPVVAPQVIG